MTSTEVIRAALRLNATIGANQEPTPEDYAACLEFLNNLGDSWSAEGLLVFAFSRESFTLTAGTASYTIGSGATFNTPRPASIDSAQIQYPSDSQDYPLEIVPQNQYDRLSLKTTQGRPTMLFYNPTYPNGTIIFGYTPDQAYSVRLNMRHRLGTLALGDTVSFPEEYRRPLVFNLAEEIAPIYGFEPSPTIVRIARESKDVLLHRNSANNSSIAELDCFVTGSGRRKGITKGAFLGGD